MAVYGYCRVSTDRQADQGESLRAQKRKIEGYAMMQDLALDNIFVEKAVSGSVRLDERPKGKLLLAGLKAGDVVITPKLDRMFRSSLDALAIFEQLKAQGVGLHMIDLGGDVCGNGISKLVFTILSAVAEAERDCIRERMIEVKEDQKARNRYLGGSIPFGWKLDTKAVVEVTAGGKRKAPPLVQEKKQQAAIAQMRELRAAGQSLRAIEAAMREAGFRLSHQGVANILSQPVGLGA